MKIWDAVDRVGPFRSTYEGLKLDEIHVKILNMICSEVPMRV